MTEAIILASNATIKPIQEEVLINTNGQYTRKETNTNATSKGNLVQQKEVVLDILHNHHQDAVM